MNTILVTGATSGIGRACCKLFAARGSSATKIIAVGRRTEMLDELANEIEDYKTGATMLGIKLDVSDRAAVAATLGKLPADFSDVDVLVNNAGLALGTEPVQAGDIDNWEKMIDVNCKGLMYATKAVLPGMVDRSRGHVVNIGSVAGNYALPGGNVYCASKAFVNHLSLAMRADLYGKGVKVTSVEPGNTETEFSVVRFKGDEEKAASVYAGESAPVAMTGDDIAEIVHFCTVGLGQHVNINRIEMMPERQGFSPFAFDRS